MQNKHKIFFLDKGFPKGGGGGGSDVWEKFPNNIVFFESVTNWFRFFQITILIMNLLNLSTTIALAWKASRTSWGETSPDRSAASKASTCFQ